MVRWFQKKTVTLDNSTGFLPGDDVGVLAPWKPAGPTEGIAMPMLTMVWERIDRGLEDTKGMATGAYYSPSPASKDRWVGNVLMDELNCDESRAKLILKEWEKQKIIEVIEYLDPLQRKPRKGVHCVAANRPDKPRAVGPMNLRQSGLESGARLAQFCAAPLKRTIGKCAGAKCASAPFKRRTYGAFAYSGVRFPAWRSAIKGG